MLVSNHYYLIVIFTTELNKIGTRGASRCNMTHLEKCMPKIRENCYGNTDEPRFSNKELQGMDLVKKIIHDEKAYNEFLTNILIYITGVVKLDKMNRCDDASSMYEGVVTCSNEAYRFVDVR